MRPQNNRSQQSSLSLCDQDCGIRQSMRKILHSDCSFFGRYPIRIVLFLCFFRYLCVCLYTVLFLCHFAHLQSSKFSNYSNTLKPVSYMYLRVCLPVLLNVPLSESRTEMSWTDADR